MKKLLECRRTFLGFFGIVCLTGLGIHIGEDISGIAVAISGIVAAVAGSNAYEKSKQPKKDGESGGY